MPSDRWPEIGRARYCFDEEVLELCRVAVDSGLIVMVRRVPAPLPGLQPPWELTPIKPEQEE